MTPSATSAPTHAAGRLPIVRFLVLFTGLLLVATGLAALSFAAEAPAAGTPAPCTSCGLSPGSR